MQFLGFLVAPQNMLFTPPIYSGEKSITGGANSRNGDANSIFGGANSIFSGVV